MGAAARKVAAGATVHVHSERFGTYEVPEERLLTFPNGLVGFPDGHRFALLDASRPDSPFRYLICVDLPELGFVVCDPQTFWPGYAEALPRPDGLDGELGVLAIVTVPANPRDMTANLMAPLMVEYESRQGRQLVLDTGHFSTNHRILPPAAEPATRAAQPAIESDHV